MTAETIPLRPPEETPDPPDGLSAESSDWWARIVDRYELEDHHLRLLEGACRAWDRAEEARAIVDDDGPVYEDRFGQPKAHPAVGTERKARNEFRLLLREIQLDAAAEPPRAPRSY